jgi:hypothetical protein
LYGRDSHDKVATIRNGLAVSKGKGCNSVRSVPDANQAVRSCNVAGIAVWFAEGFLIPQAEK